MQGSQAESAITPQLPKIYNLTTPPLITARSPSQTSEGCAISWCVFFFEVLRFLQEKKLSSRHPSPQKPAVLGMCTSGASGSFCRNQVGAKVYKFLRNLTLLVVDDVGLGNFFWIYRRSKHLIVLQSPSEETSREVFLSGED